MGTYTIDRPEGGYAKRSSDGMSVPWDHDNDCPLDMAGLAGRMWVDDGSPKSTPYVAPAAVVPDGPTLGDWRTALVLWNKLDAIDTAIAALKADSNPQKQMLGKVAEQRFQFSNNVFRAQLIAFKDMLGFSEADVDESLWRADLVAKGDLRGTWPLLPA